MSNLKKTSITVNENDFKEFKEYAKKRNSDSSKEIRKLIAKYILESKKIFKAENE